MFEYQLNNRYFTQISDELKEIGIEEVVSQKAWDIQSVYRGIYFKANPGSLYSLNYTSRYLTRILAPLISFKCHDDSYLYRKAREVKWAEIFNVNNSFAVFASVNHSRIKHSQYAALRLKDAIADYFRASAGERPSVDPNNPDVWINLHIERNQATISLDTSGGSLHRRGYRKVTGKTPMQETVAAAMIRFSEWEGQKPLYDPMCGSGTLLCEALMCFCRIPSGLLRQRFGFEFLPDYDKELWTEIKQREDANLKSFQPGVIAGSDISKSSVNRARENIGNLPHGQEVELGVCDFSEIPDLTDKTIISNPPYGIRQGSRESAGKLYKEFGDFLKKRCQGSEVYVYFGDRSLIPAIGLRPTWKKPLRNGGLDGRLAKFEIY